MNNLELNFLDNFSCFHYSLPDPQHITEPQPISFHVHLATPTPVTTHIVDSPTSTISGEFRATSGPPSFMHWYVQTVQSYFPSQIFISNRCIPHLWPHQVHHPLPHRHHSWSWTNKKKGITNPLIRRVEKEKEHSCMLQSVSECLSSSLEQVAWCL